MDLVHFRWVGFAALATTDPSEMNQAHGAYMALSDSSLSYTLQNRL